ncbi:MAG: hypothetical protein RDV41_13260 [Planctomycetota bacterium]|nr:hypothetical protein [Planctomycetota bacterium]
MPGRVEVSELIEIRGHGEPAKSAFNSGIRQNAKSTKNARDIE